MIWLIGKTAVKSICFAAEMGAAVFGAALGHIDLAFCVDVQFPSFVTQWFLALESSAAVPSGANSPLVKNGSGPSASRVVGIGLPAVSHNISDTEQLVIRRLEFGPIAAPDPRAMDPDGLPGGSDQAEAGGERRGTAGRAEDRGPLHIERKLHQAALCIGPLDRGDPAMHDRLVPGRRRVVALVGPATLARLETEG